MKKLIFPVAFIVMVVSSAAAQDEILYAKLKEEVVPAEEITAVTQNLEDGLTVTDYYAAPTEVLSKDWSVTINPEEKELSDKEFFNYEVDFSGKNISGKGVYDKKGNLVSFTEKMKNTALPLTIQKSIYKEFPGWRATGDHKTVMIDRNDQEMINYKVMLNKCNEKKRVVYNKNGELIKAGRSHKMLFKKSQCKADS